MKAFAVDKINVTKELKFVLGREENIAGGENAFHCGRRRKCFSPVPTMFSKGFFHRGVKSRDSAVKG